MGVFRVYYTEVEATFPGKVCKSRVFISFVTQTELGATQIETSSKKVP